MKHVSKSISLPGSRKIIQVLIVLGLSGNSLPAAAEIYTEVGFELGGDTLARTSLEDLDAGGGFKFALGWQQFIGGFEDVGFIFSLGYLFDYVTASNGEAESDAFVLELVYFRDFGPHRIGIGGSYHLNPDYEDDIDGFAPLKINFDDATGVLARYSYRFAESVEIGVRYTVMDYEFNGQSIDAGGFGFFLSGTF